MSAGSMDLPDLSMVTIFSIPDQIQVRSLCNNTAGQMDLDVSLMDGSWAGFMQTAKVKVFFRSLTSGYGVGNTSSTNGDRFFLQFTKNGGGPTVTIDGSAAFGNPCFIQWTATVVNHQ
jgi:hypothetical protein